MRSPTTCRLLGLDPAAQKHVFDTFQAVLEATVEEARREGNYDEGIVDVAGSSVSLTSPPQTVRTVRCSPPPPPHTCRSVAHTSNCTHMALLLELRLCLRFSVPQLHVTTRSFGRLSIFRWETRQWLPPGASRQCVDACGCRTSTRAPRRCCTASRWTGAAPGPPRSSCCPRRPCSTARCASRLVAQHSSCSTGTQVCRLSTDLTEVSL